MTKKQLHNENHIYTHQGHDCGESWYYALGGPVLTIKQIKAKVEASDHRGYLENELRSIDAQPEPRRLELFLHYREEFRAELAENLSSYRRAVRKLNEYRASCQQKAPPTECHKVHTEISVTYALLTIDFGHLALIDDLLSKQPELDN
ncbi:MAG: hypothetical protein AAF890_01370 [Pseudomonadota bacterium]